MARSSDDYDIRDDINWFRDELRQRDRLIAELRSEADRDTDLIRRLGEHAEDYDNTLESWRETFDMVPTDSGGWTWEPFWDEWTKLIEKHDALVKQWNRAVPILNGSTQEVGRPLAASKAQVNEVLFLRQTGSSLRAIADETGLSLRTVRTIVGRKAG